ncbi:MAG TPA: di-heme oxidoredictase family protein [Planctomycetota bacterium]
MRHFFFLILAVVAALLAMPLLGGAVPLLGGHATQQDLGKEVAIPTHLADGDEYVVGVKDLLEHGKRLFEANWTAQEGAGRPLTKGTGAALTDPSDPLVFPRAFNRVSARDANACSGCHNAPFGVPGGGGDFVTGVFVLGHRFDFATFDQADPIVTKGTVQEDGSAATLPTIANYRATLGMFGAGYIEMLAREMTMDLQFLRDNLAPGASVALVTKDVEFGELVRNGDGTWDTSLVEGLPAPSLASSGALNPPSLILQPFHQAGAVVSLRQFTNNAFNHHHGMQTAERFGAGTDPDGDGFTDELTRADMTAVSMYQAVLAVPGRVISDDPVVEQAVWDGEQLFDAIGCARCHVSALPLNDSVFSEPNPFNPAGNLRLGDAPPLALNLNSKKLPQPRLSAKKNKPTWVPAYTDLKLHNICAGPGDPNTEPLDMLQAAGSAGFFAGNQMFLTKKLWGAANEPPYFHHGQFTTLREAVLGHDGEALTERQAFEGLSDYGRDSIIEFLKSLQVLPPGTKHLVVDQDGHPKKWPPN